MTAVELYYQNEIGMVQDRMLEMATCANHMVSLAVEALMTGNLFLVREVVERDVIVDKLDLEIEKLCLKTIATQHLADRDLRIIGTALKASTDIERIGDYAVDIAKIGRRMVKAQVIYQPVVDLPHLTQLSRAMLYNALRAFIDHDLNLAEQVIRADDVVDRQYHQMRTSLTEMIAEEPGRGILVLNVLFAVKYLERISDHVVTIAERVQFIETGLLRTPALRDFLHDEL